MSAVLNTRSLLSTNRVFERLFNEAFSEDYQTRLCGGADEPLYRPGEMSAEEGRVACIYYRADYAASALHEVAHWCVAGEARRQLEDYGYWYAEDGRSLEQQILFEQVEVKPQALEWIFSVASKQAFKVSADNLAAELGPSESFKRAIHQQALAFCEHGLNTRAMRFIDALADFFEVEQVLARQHYRLEDL